MFYYVFICFLFCFDLLGSVLLGCFVRGCSKDEDRQPTFASGAAYERSLQDIEVSTTTFLQLATERFDARTAASGLQAEANWTFDHHQVIQYSAGPLLYYKTQTLAQAGFPISDGAFFLYINFSTTTPRFLLSL